MTGQIFFRGVNGHPEIPNKKLMMFCGVIAVDDDCPFKEEHQYTLAGTNDGLINIIPLTEVDLKEQMAGESINGVLRSPVWRV